MKATKQKGISFQYAKWNDKKWKSDGTIYTLYKKTQFRRLANLFLNRYGHIYTRVSYGKGFYNDGVYKTHKDMEEAFTIFIEQNLIDYATKEIK